MLQTSEGRQEGEGERGRDQPKNLYSYNHNQWTQIVGGWVQVGGDKWGERRTYVILSTVKKKIKLRVRSGFLYHQW